MKANVGTIDRVLRVIAALVLASIAYTQSIGWLYVVAAVVLATAVFSRCGLYALFGMSTCPIKTKAKK